MSKSATDQLALELVRTSTVLHEAYLGLNRAHVYISELQLMLQQYAQYAEEAKAAIASSESQCKRAKDELEVYKLLMVTSLGSQETPPPLLSNNDEYIP